MSGDRTTPRYDVVATTRRSRSKAQKRAIVAEVDVGGATLSEVARRHGMHSSLLFCRRKTLGSVMSAPPIFAGAETSTPSTPAFVPVLLPPPSLPAPAIASGSSGAGPDASVIEIVLDGGRTVRVGAEVDTSALLRIIDALEKSTQPIRTRADISALVNSPRVAANPDRRAARSVLRARSRLSGSSSASCSRHLRPMTAPDTFTMPGIDAEPNQVGMALNRKSAFC